MRKFKQSVAIVLSVLMLMSIAMIGVSAAEVTAPSVRGTLPGASWDKTTDADNTMALKEDGTYSFTYSQVPAGQYAFKVFFNKSEYGMNGVKGNKSFNYEINVAEECDVTITFNAETHVATYDGESVSPVTELAIDSIQLMGSVVEPAWSFDSAPVLTETDEKVYSTTVKNVAPGSYQFKFAANGGWTANWGSGDDDEALSGNANFNSGNIYLDVAEASDVTFTLDLTAFEYYPDRTGATYTVELAAASGETEDTTPVDTQDVTGDTPADTTPVDTQDVTGDTPADTTPVDTQDVTGDTPADTTPVDTQDVTGDTPADTTPADTDETAPVDTTPVVTDPVDTTPVDTQDVTGDTPADTTPADTDDTTPVVTEPAETEPADTDPVGFYLVGSEEICGVEWGWENPFESGTPKLKASKDGSFYYYVAKNVPSSAENEDDTGEPRFEFKAIYFDGSTVTWHPGGMGNNTYVTVDEDGSTVVFKFVMLTSRPNKEGEDPEAVEAMVYAPGEEVPEVDPTTDTEPVVTEPSGSDPVDTAPVDTDPTTPVDTTPVDTTPVDTTPVDTTPVTPTDAPSDATTAPTDATTAPTDATTAPTEATTAAPATQATQAPATQAPTTVAPTTSATQATTAAASTEKAKNTITVKAKKVTVKAGKSVKAAKAFKVTKAVGKVTYKKVKGNKKITVKTNGTIVVKKGLKKGTYTIKVKVTATGNDTTKAGSKTVKIKVKVK